MQYNNDLYNKDFEFGFGNYDYPFDGEKFGELEYRKKISILEGATGVILTLMNIINDRDIEWKKIFFII